MRLEDINGSYILRGIALDKVNPIDSNSNGVSFRLDDTVYTVYENPDDGYRSYAYDGVEVEDLSKSSKKLKDFTIKVIAKQDENPDRDILQLVSVKSGNIIFEIGTDGSCDYYPNFVYRWSPDLA